MKTFVLYKKGDRNDLANYTVISIRPIFFLKFLKKLFILDWSLLLNSKRDQSRIAIITESQFGFRKDYSTQLSLLNQKEFMLQNIEDRKHILGIFIDFTKAFDSLNRNLLTQKLEFYSIRGAACQILQSYLNHRLQYVSTDNTTSSIKCILSGVPQGSILIQYLFNIYINYVVNVDPNVKYIIHANDTSLSIADDDCDRLFWRGNQVLHKLAKWALCNGLVINVCRMHVVVFVNKLSS